MELVPLEFFHLAIGLILSLDRKRRETIRNRRFRSFFGTSLDARVDLWHLFCCDFSISTMPVRLLWVLMFVKKCSTESVNAARAGVHEGVLRDREWLVLTAISNINFVSVTCDNATTILDFID